MKKEDIVDTVEYMAAEVTKPTKVLMSEDVHDELCNQMYPTFSFLPNGKPARPANARFVEIVTSSGTLKLEIVKNKTGLLKVV